MTWQEIAMLGRLHGPASWHPGEVARWLRAGTGARLRDGWRWLRPDHVVQQEQFRRAFGRPIDWRRPTTFNEKIHWIRRYERSPLLTRLADKVAVRDYVAERCGARVLPEAIGVWERVEEIPWATLPLPCVLKVNWGSGMNWFCRDRASLDVARAAAQLTAWMSRNYYWNHREWAYKNIRPPRILGERLLLTPAGQIPPDYKMFCFDGVPRFVQVDNDRFGSHTKDLYAMPWRRLDVAYHYPASGRDQPPPPQIEALLEMAAALSRGIPFVRVDGYDLGDRIAFGECTLYPNAGLVPFEPAAFDAELGSWLTVRRIGAHGGAHAVKEKAR
jgi:teichuronopeptide biosynthesis TupA-like protein